MLSYCFVVFMLIRLRLRLLLLLRETKREITGAHRRSSGRSREIKREVTGDLPPQPIRLNVQEYVEHSSQIDTVSESVELLSKIDMSERVRM